MQTNDNRDLRIRISKALQVLGVFRAIDPDMPMGAAVSLLMIANGETADSGLSVTELSKLGDFALSSASRYVQALAEMDRHHRPGHDLVSDQIDPMERRRKVLKLTPKGKRVVNQLP
jgi:DNA-binding MarR family transcriptional regulator